MAFRSQGVIMDKKRQKIRIAAFGYGNRVKKYLSFLDAEPEVAELAGIIEPDPCRLQEARQRHSSCGDIFHVSADTFFASSPDIDAVIIGTPDDTHYGLCMESLRSGWHVLLEKPAAQTMQQCRDIADLALKKGVNVVLCHVLRYHPLYKCLKRIMDSHRYGDIVSVNHIVNVGIDRTCHTFVRGPWSDSRSANPMILSKCCHDLDLIVWLTGQKADKVSTFGSLKWFCGSNAPEGSAARCVDCAIERECPFSAIDLYIRRKEWTGNFDVPKGSTLETVLEEEMRSGRYGRCVYGCDNDVVDHQVLSMKMDNGIVVTLSMDCFTMKDGRITDIKCVFGEITVQDNVIRAQDFRTGEEQVWDFASLADSPLHAGADHRIVEEFLGFVRAAKSGASTNRSPVQTPDRPESGESSHADDLPEISSSLESHRICFMAEESRLSGKTVSTI